VTEDVGPALAWYVVQVRPRAERAVAAGLHGDGFDVFAPEYLREQIRQRRKERVPAPLFPGYIFVRFDIDAAATWKPINRMQGVVTVLASVASDPEGDEIPLQVPDEFIAELRHRRDSAGYLDVVDETKPIRYRRGEYLRIVGGTFQGFVGLYLGSDRQRVGVLLEFLGGVREVKVPDEQVVLAELTPETRKRRSRASFQRTRSMQRRSAGFKPSDPARQ